MTAQTDRTIGNWDFSSSSTATWTESMTSNVIVYTGDSGWRYVRASSAVNGDYYQITKDVGTFATHFVVGIELDCPGTSTNYNQVLFYIHGPNDARFYFELRNDSGSDWQVYYRRADTYYASGVTSTGSFQKLFFDIGINTSDVTQSSIRISSVNSAGDTVLDSALVTGGRSFSGTNGEILLKRYVTTNTTAQPFIGINYIEAGTGVTSPLVALPVAASGSISSSSITVTDGSITAEATGTGGPYCTDREIGKWDFDNTTTDTWAQTIVGDFQLNASKTFGRYFECLNNADTSDTVELQKNITGFGTDRVCVAIKMNDYGFRSGWTSNNLILFYVSVSGNIRHYFQFDGSTNTIWYRKDNGTYYNSGVHCDYSGTEDVSKLFLFDIDVSGGADADVTIYRISSDLNSIESSVTVQSGRSYSCLSGDVAVKRYGYDGDATWGPAPVVEWIEAGDSVAGLVINGSVSSSSVTVTSGAVTGAVEAISNATGNIASSAVTVTEGNVTGIVDETGSAGTSAITVTPGAVSGIVGTTADIGTSAVTITSGSVTATASAQADITSASISISSGAVQGDVSTAAQIASSPITVTSGDIDGYTGVISSISSSVINVTAGSVQSEVSTSGEISASSISVISGQIQGNISASGVIGSSSVNIIAGEVSGSLGMFADISSSSVSISTGSVEGNASAVSSVSSSSILVSTGSVQGGIGVLGDIGSSAVTLSAGETAGQIDYLAEIDSFDIVVTDGELTGSIESTGVTGSIAGFEVVLITGLIDGIVSTTAEIISSTITITTGELTDGEIMSEWVYLVSPVSVATSPTEWAEMPDIPDEPDNTNIVYTEDIGTAILVDCAVDLSAVVGPKIRVRKPDGDIIEWSATVASIDGESRYLRYLIQDGDLDQAGTYYVQSHLSKGSWTGYGNRTKLRVNQNVYGDVI